MAGDEGGEKGVGAGADAGNMHMLAAPSDGHRARALPRHNSVDAGTLSLIGDEAYVNVICPRGCVGPPPAPSVGPRGRRRIRF